MFHRLLALVGAALVSVLAVAPAQAQLLPPGAEVVLYQKDFHRLVRMNVSGLVDASAPLQDPSAVPIDWTGERFRVVDGGSGLIALYNVASRRFIRISASGDADSGGQAASLPPDWTWERFQVVDLGGGMAALYNPAQKRFLRMNDKADCDSSSSPTASVPAAWQWERFQVVVLPAAGASAPATAPVTIDPNAYYRLTTQWQGEGKSLDVVNDGKNNKLQLAPTGNKTGQYWRFLPAGVGYYRLTTQWQGEGKSLDVVNDGKNNQLQLAPTGNRSGQSWKLTPLGGNSYRLTCQWQGDGKSLDVVNDGKNNQIQLAPTGDKAGQYWVLTKLTQVASNDFYMVMMADPQYPWTRASDDGRAQSDADRDRESEQNNRYLVASINSRTKDLGADKVKGVIMNGDLTAYGHDDEVKKFNEIYGGLTVKKYLGLGNHDYANNVDNCGENNCATRSVLLMRDHVRSELQADNFDYLEFDSYQGELRTDSYGSLSYSWDVGSVHFVQLHNFPLYHTAWNGWDAGKARRQFVNITSSLSWLKNDLAKARVAGKIIILNLHDPDEHWKNKNTQQDVDAFTALLATYHVAAVFAGHYHGNLGEQQVNGYGQVPVIFCGSSSYQTYLVAKFSGTSMTVEKLASGLGSYKNIPETKTYPLYATAEDVTIPPPDGWVRFHNDAGYVTRYTLSYKSNGQTITKKTDSLAVGNKAHYPIPGDATDISVKGEWDTSLGWKTSFNKSVSATPRLCYRSTGTIFNADWDNACK